MWQALPRSNRPRKGEAKAVPTHFEKAAMMQEPHFRDAFRALLDEGALFNALKLILSDGISSASDPLVLDKMKTLHPAQIPTNILNLAPRPNGDGYA
jgi:hypothetical protein